MQQSIPHSSHQFQKLFWGVVIPILALAVAGWMGNEMLVRTERQLLWGWRPFFLMTSIWIAVLALVKGFGKHDPRRDRHILLSILSGVLLSAGFPPSPLTPLLFIGLVPLLMVEQSLRESSPGGAKWKVFRYAFNTFFIWNVCTTWWILNTSFLPGVFANVMNAVFMAMVFTAFHHACTVLPQRVHGIVLAALWIAFEILHITWELSWPWLTLGNALAQFPSLIQWYEYTGVFGGSLWLLIANYWIYRWYVNGRKMNRALVGITLWLLVPVVFSLIRYATIEVPEGNVDVVVVQPNFEPHYEKFDVSQREQLSRVLSLSRNALTDSTDYLVFPETTFSGIVLNDLERDFRIRELRRLVEEYPNLKIVSGLDSYRLYEEREDLNTIREYIDQDGDTIYYDAQNSAIQLTFNEPAEMYFKSKLVPGAEFLPYKDFLPFLKPLVDMLQGSIAGLTGQPSREVFFGDETGIAPVICYESIYGQYVGGYVQNGADMIFIVTNDGWWDNTPGHIQHLKIGAMRAIEHRRPIARSANTGISCFVNIRGDILQPTKYGETIAISGKVAEGTGVTFYTKWGDMIARIAVFLALMILARVFTLSVLNKKRRAQ